MTENTLTPGLWTPRSVDETRAIYADWADHYDADVTGAGYATPARIAKALRAAGADPAAPVLDYGCGTGLSGAALAAAGFTQCDGTDISAEMLEQARAKAIYGRLWVSEPATAPPAYPAMVATGVISLGAAPPETLALLLSSLAPGGLLAFSYNDATLGDQTYLDALATARSTATLLSEAHGPHLPEKGMGATVYVLRKT